MPIVKTCYQRTLTKVNAQSMINWTVIDQLGYQNDARGCGYASPTCYDRPLVCHTDRQAVSIARLRRDLMLAADWLCCLRRLSLPAVWVARWPVRWLAQGRRLLAGDDCSRGRIRRWSAAKRTAVAPVQTRRHSRSVSCFHRLQRPTQGICYICCLSVWTPMACCVPRFIC